MYTDFCKYQVPLLKYGDSFFLGGGGNLKKSCVFLDYIMQHFPSNLTADSDKFVKSRRKLSI